MGTISKASSILVMGIILVAAFSGTILYYNGAVNDKNSKIALMQTNIANLINENINLNNVIINQSSEIANLTNQVASLNSQISALKSQQAIIASQEANLTSANLVTALGITEIPSTSTYNEGSASPYNHLYISGTVTNTGGGTAYDAGLHVVAYAADGTIEISTTVPLDDGASFGTDAATDVYGGSSAQLESLFSGQTATISIAIFHEGTVTKWDITPVSSNSS